MLKEILTLDSEIGPLQYYVLFGRERRHFSFQPTFKNRQASPFVIHVRNDEMVVEGEVDEVLNNAAREKVKDILSSMMFDQF
jgi:hypothetical protein